MSRVSDYDDYEEDFPNQAEFWQANAERALKGKRGRKALAELREALLMLPEKRLVEGAVSTVALDAKYRDEPDTTPGWRNWTKEEALKKCAEQGPGVCAVGAYLMRKRVLELGETPEQAMAALPSHADVEDRYIDDTAQLGAAAGLTSYVAYELAYRNDETFRDCTPEQRYERFLAWIDKELAEAS